MTRGPVGDGSLAGPRLGRLSIQRLRHGSDGVAQADGSCAIRAGAGVDGEAVVVVEAGGVGPGGEGGLAAVGEAAGEGGEVGAGFGVAGGDDAAGAGVDAFEADRADLEGDGLIGAGEEVVFPERGGSFELEVGAEAAAHVLGGEAGEPARDFGECGAGEEGGAGGFAIVGEAAVAVFDEADGDTQGPAEPGFDGGEVLIEGEGGLRGVVLDAGETWVQRGSKRARMRWMAAVRLALMSWPAASTRAKRRS